MHPSKPIGQGATPLDAIDDVIAQIPEQVKSLVKRKKELGDKRFSEVKDKLYALLEEAEALQKKAKGAAAAAATEKDDDEEPDSPALLTTKMVPLLRKLRDGKTRMHALICTAGKNTAVLVMQKTIPTSRRKLLAEAVDAKGGMKYVVGECSFESNALTFVVQSPGGQLAKRVRQALLDQTAVRTTAKTRATSSPACSRSAVRRGVGRRRPNRLRTWRGCESCASATTRLCGTSTPSRRSCAQ